MTIFAILALKPKSKYGQFALFIYFIFNFLNFSQCWSCINWLEDILVPISVRFLVQVIFYFLLNFFILISVRFRFRLTFRFRSIIPDGNYANSMLKAFFTNFKFQLLLKGYFFNNNCSDEGPCLKLNTELTEMTNSTVVTSANNSLECQVNKMKIVFFPIESFKPITTTFQASLLDRNKMSCFD